ncbi:hypothetical protein B0T22DRAFT_451148 [Podospora appendiculata]|uniref:RRM domain-containing protein n=1 Tax=Podospora appendiculata TaxID=314037 RepID=A0AAE0XIC4_9PEZI|nr:hypothetical protein B0T22DRAFT_451148 [Podospora appendiculata]
MQSIRRAALRSASSATRAVSTKALPTPFASNVARRAEASRIGSVCAARFFSQTTRFQNTEEKIEEKTEENTPEQASDPFAETLQESTQGTESFPPGQPTPYGAFIRNLIFDATEEHLHGLFEKYGGVNFIQIVRDPRGMSKGFGFVYFNNLESFKEACANVNGSFWHGRRITCIPKLAADKDRTQRATKSPGEPTQQLFIGNIPYETTDSELNAIFNGLSNLKDVRIAVDRTTGWPRGFAHADFVDVESATTAHQKLQGVTLADRKLVIDFASGYVKRPEGGEGFGRREGGAGFGRREPRQDRRSGFEDNF